VTLQKRGAHIPVGFDEGQSGGSFMSRPGNEDLH
jgi:hypothetical protein